jgi:hypothetical protein
MYFGFSFNRNLSVLTDRFATAGLLIGKPSIFALAPRNVLSRTLPDPTCLLIMVVKVIAKVISITDSIERLINQSFDRLIGWHNVSFYLLAPRVCTILRNTGCVTASRGTHTAH